MGEASGIRAGRAYVELYGDDTGLDDALGKSEAKVTTWSSRIAGAGRAVAGTFGAAIAAVGTTAAMAASATVAMGSAGVAAMGFGGASVKAASGTLQVVEALESLRSVGSRAWSFLSAGIGRGSVVFRAVIGMVTILSSQLIPLSNQFAAVAKNIQAIADAAAKASAGAAKISTSATPKKSMFAGTLVGDVAAEAARAAQKIHGELSDRYPKIMSGVDAIASGAVTSVKFVGNKLLAELKRVSEQLKDPGSVSSQLAATAQKSARRGQWSSFFSGDKQAHAFYTEARAVADGAAVAAAFGHSFQSGIETRLRVAARRGSTAVLSGFAQLANTATLGAGSAVANVSRGIGRSLGLLPPVVNEIGGAAKSSFSSIQFLADGFRSASTAAGSFFRALAGKATLLSGIAGGIVGMGSVAAGFDLRTVSSRVMNSKSFASGAEEMHKRGNAMVSQADVAKAQALKTAMEGLFQAAEAAWAQIGAAVAPIVTRSLQGTTQLVAGVAKWIAKNRELVSSFFSLAMPVFKVSTGFALVARFVGMLAPAVGLILSPIGLIAAALTAGVALWLWWSDSGTAAVKWLAGRFGALTETFGDAWGGIVDAVSSGELTLAGRIAWAGLKLGFLQAIEAMGGSWSEFSRFFLNAISAIGDAFEVVVAGFRTSWRKAQQGIAHGLIDIMGWVDGRDTTEDHKNLDEDADYDINKIKQERDVSMVNRVSKLQQDLAQLPASDAAEIERLKEELGSLTKKAKETKGDPFAAVMTAPEKPKVKAETDAGKIKEHAITGTFNAAAVSGMAAGSALDKVAENTKETNVYLQAMAKSKKTGLFGSGGF